MTLSLIGVYGGYKTFAENLEKLRKSHVIAGPGAYRDVYLLFQPRNDSSECTKPSRLKQTE